MQLWPIFYFLWTLHRHFPDALTVPRVADATHRAIPTLYHYFHGRYRNLHGYVSVALAMIDLLHSAGAIDPSERTALLRQLRQLTADALLAEAGLIDLFNDADKEPTTEQKTIKSVHLLVRDAHYHDAKIITFYKSSKYFGQKFRKLYV